ncbi:hypothetical protein IQ06DRAFT_306374 [Phaeosphaeriaceae sp. SRC1lsM3a]|nr:hypothetical protein IQ06DRAFT_306374 [Stagonospora sp. SRC1lsM3a]
MSNNDPGNQDHKNLDYPEPFEVSFDRYLNNPNRFHYGMNSGPVIASPPSSPPPPPGPNRPWAAQYLGGPQARPTVPPQHQPVGQHDRMQNIVAPPLPPPFQSGPYAGPPSSPFLAGQSAFNIPLAYETSPNSSNTGQMTLQPRRNALVPINGFIGSAASPSHHNINLFPSTPASSHRSNTGRGRGATRGSIRSGRLQPGFEWDTKALAMLAMWKDVKKKGMQVVAESGDFPGHNKQSLDNVWNARKGEARRFLDQLRREEQEERDGEA